MTTEVVRIERVGARGELVINRRADDNRITWEVLTALVEGLSDLSADPSIAVIVLRGSGHRFSAGLDLESLRAVSDPDAALTTRKELHVALLDCPKPTLVALEGTAIGGAAAIALSCDFVIAGDTAGIWLPEVLIDLVATMNLAVVSMKHNESLMLELAVAARPLIGANLYRRGLALEVAPDSNVVARTRAAADEFARLKPHAVAHTKRLIRALGSPGGTRAHLDHVYAMHEATQTQATR